MQVSAAGSAQILDNIINDNFTDWGSGLTLYRIVLSAGSPTVKGNLVQENNGHGILADTDALIVQNLITGNKGAGVLWTIWGGGPHLINNTIADNDNSQGSGILAEGYDSNVEIINNIIVAKAGQTAVWCSASLGASKAPVFKFNDVFSPAGSAFGGTCADQAGLNGNISSDPLFIDPSIGEYHVNAGSPVIDAGDNSAAELPDMDLSGGSRIIDCDGNGQAIVDIGAFESDPAGIIQFDAAAFSVAEEAGNAGIVLTRRGGDSGIITLDFSTSDGTATSGSDYTSIMQTVSFNDGETTETVFVPIFQDSLLEGVETVNLTLSNPTGGAQLGVRRAAVLSISDLVAEDFFPATPGDEWVYRRDGLDTFTTNVLDKIVLINGIETRVFHNSDGSEEYYSADENGVKLHRLYTPKVLVVGLGRVNLTFTFAPPIQFSNGVTHVGDTVLSSGIAQSNKLPKIGVLNLPYDAAFTIEGFDTVTVPAGVFDVIRLQGTFAISGQPSDTLTFDLAEGIGRVKGIESFLGVTTSTELLEYRVGIHDLAVTKIIAPTSVTLTAKNPVQTKQIRVELQNRSPHSETILDSDALEHLVSLTVQSLGTTCPDIVSALHGSSLPLIIKPKKKFAAVFDVTFDCANDPFKNSAKDPGHEDFRYIATVNHAALDGEADVHPADDICPRDMEPPGVDLYPDSSIRDSGCGNKKPDRSLGADIITDVVLK